MDQEGNIQAQSLNDLHADTYKYVRTIKFT
jgi:hypothetical protein